MGLFTRLVGLAVIGFGSYAIWDGWKAGYFSLPDNVPENATKMSFTNGLRAIILDPVNEKKRKYLGLPAEVPKWYKDSWSFCEAPKGEVPFKLPDVGPGSRLEAICTLDVDGEKIVRGLIYSVPRI